MPETVNLMIVLRTHEHPKFYLLDDEQWASAMEEQGDAWAYIGENEDAQSAMFNSVIDLNTYLSATGKVVGQEDSCWGY